MSRATIILAQKITVQTFPTSKFKTLAPRIRHAQNTHLYSLASSSKQHSDMSHFGRSGPPDIRDTFSLLVLNITFRICPPLLSNFTALSYFYKKTLISHKLLSFLPRRHHRRRSFPSLRQVRQGSWCIYTSRSKVYK